MAAGMFVPALLAGACFGRIVGHLLHIFDASHGTFADAGTYALMGAAAFTSGITRITISLSIMILEATGDMQYVLPLMITTLAAQYFGNLCSEGMDEMKIESMRYPYLVEEEQLGSGPSGPSGSYDATLGCNLVTDIMSGSPVTVDTIVSVGEVLKLLTQCKHNCFPVVVNSNRNSSSSGSTTNTSNATNSTNASAEDASKVLLGTISRNILCSLLLHKAYTTPTHTSNKTTAGVWSSSSSSKSSESSDSAVETDE